MHKDQVVPLSEDFAIVLHLSFVQEAPVNDHNDEIAHHADGV